MHFEERDSCLQRSSSIFCTPLLHNAAVELEIVVESLIRAREDDLLDRSCYRAR